MKRWKICDGCDVDGVCEKQKCGKGCKAVERYKKGGKNGLKSNKSNLVC